MGTTLIITRIRQRDIDLKVLGLQEMSTDECELGQLLDL